MPMTIKYHHSTKHQWSLLYSVVELPKSQPDQSDPEEDNVLHMSIYRVLVLLLMQIKFKLYDENRNRLDLAIILYSSYL